jgi:hypothetical protein
MKFAVSASGLSGPEQAAFSHSIIDLDLYLAAIDHLYILAGQLLDQLTASLCCPHLERQNASVCNAPEANDDPVSV